MTNQLLLCKGTKKRGKSKKIFLFLFRVLCNFGGAKVTKNRGQNKINLFVFYAEMTQPHLLHHQQNHQFVKMILNFGP